MASEQHYILDTHALIWHLTGDQQLSDKARKVFDEIGSGKATGVIPVIVLLECLDIAEKNKAGVNFSEVLQKLINASNFAVLELNFSLVLVVQQMKDYEGLHDRVIAASAHVYDAPLVTKDEEIRELYPQTIW